MTTFVITNPARQAACDSIVDLLDDGGGTTAYCVIMNAASATDIVNIPLGAADAFGAASTAGVATMTATSPSASASTSLTAAQFQLRNSHSTTPAEVMHGDVGTSGATMTISNTAISSGDYVKITSMTVTVPAS